MNVFLEMYRREIMKEMTKYDLFLRFLDAKYEKSMHLKYYGEFRSCLKFLLKSIYFEMYLKQLKLHFKNISKLGQKISVFI